MVAGVFVGKDKAVNTQAVCEVNVPRHLRPEMDLGVQMMIC